MKAIYNRRSIRSYTSEKVGKEMTEQLLRAAMQAPSAGNQQPWEFLVVENPQTLEKLSQVGAYFRMLAEAPMGIILLGTLENLRFPEFWEQDLAACTQNLLLEAADQGLGAVWLGVAPMESRERVIREILHLPKHVRPFAMIAVGHPKEEQGNHFVDRYRPDRIHWEKY